MNGAELVTYTVLGCGGLVAVFKLGVAIGYERATRAVEKRRGIEVKALNSFVQMVWYPVRTNGKMVTHKRRTT